MRSIVFDINQEAVIQYTKKLGKLHKSDLPLAIRSTLNDTAFEAYRKIPLFFNKNFTVRKKTFLRSHTSVVKSKNTFKVSQMVAQTGVIKGKSKAGDNLLQQEYGGTIADSEFIPLKTARIGKNERKLISKANYLKNIRSNKRMHQSNEFRKAAIKAGKGAFIMFNDLLVKIDAVKTHPLYIKSTPLYYIKEGKQAKVDKNPFVKPAALLASKKIKKFFIKNAQYRIKKRMK